MVIRETIDETHGNVLKTWEDLGRPSSPTAAEIAQLKRQAVPGKATESIKTINHGVTIEVSLTPHCFCLIELK